MAGRAETSTIDRASRMRRIQTFRQSIREREEQANSPLSLALIDSYLWSISKLVSDATPTSQKIKKQKLEQLLNLCRAGHEEVQRLQRAAMEIPELADPQDKSAVESLARLLHHENSHLRKNACKAIGLIGGKEASEILHSLIESSSDLDMRRAATEALQYCETQELTGELEAVRWEALTNHQKELRRLRTLFSPHHRPPVILVACTAVGIALSAGILFSLYAARLTFYGHGPGFLLGLALFCAVLAIEMLLGLTILARCWYAVAIGSTSYATKTE
jgi:hypothetical protein